MTEKEAIEQYNEYLTGHIGNISEALELLKDLEIPFVVDNYEELKEICSKHDASKYEDVEYIPYRKHFYPINDEEKLESEAFELACRHHIKNNKHHWDYWLNDNNELEIPDEHEYKLYCVERCCDWLSMANQHGEGPMNWYNANKDAMIMPDYGFELCEEILSKVPEDFELSFKGVRGKLDESYAYAKDVTTKELDRNHVMFITYGSYGEHVEHFDNVARLFDYIKQCGGFKEFKGIMWFIKSDYKDGEFYLVRDRYHKGGWKWEDVNGSIVDAFDSKTFAIKPDKKAAVKQMYNAGDGTFMIDLNDGWVTDYGTNYIQATDKNDAIIELNYRVSYVGDDKEINESSDYWKTLEPKIEDTENDRKGVEMYKEKISNGYHRPVLVNKEDEILDGNHTMTAYQELGIEPKMLYRGERSDFYKADAETKGDAEKAIHIMIQNGTAKPINEAVGPSKEYLKKNFKKIKFNSNFSSAEIVTEEVDYAYGLSKQELQRRIKEKRSGYNVNRSQGELYNMYNSIMRAEKKKELKDKQKVVNKEPEIKTSKQGDNYIKNDSGGYTKLDKDYFESFKVERGGKGYLVEASMSQLKRTTLTQDPTRAKKSKRVQSKYIGISKYGVLNFMTSSETHSGVKWYQEVQFPSFQGFMNIVEQGDDIDATDVQKAMKSDNIKISCFTEDTEVQTLDGMKKIKDIKVGDKVLTHTGKYQDVLQTFENDYNGEMIEINGVKSTPNHPYLVKLPNGDIEWKMACEVTSDMKLLEPVSESVYADE